MFKTITIPARDVQVFDGPLPLADVRKLQDEEGWLDINLLVSFDDLTSTGDTDGLNDLCDNLIFSDHGFLSDIGYKVVAAMPAKDDGSGDVIIKVTAKVEGSDDDDEEEAAE